MSDLTRMESPPRGTAGPDDPARRLSSLWRRGEGPRVEEFLAAGGVSDPAVVVTVLRVDQRERRRRGQWVPAESYLDVFPAVREDPESAIDLVFAEYLLREQFGDSPTLDEYTRRFPQYADQLKLQVELHRAMEEGHGRQWPATWTEGRADPPEFPRTNPESDSGPHPEIPGYEIQEVLGWGGMGVVYRAWQQMLSRMVALKMVQAGPQASPQALARFRVEAEAVARLNHPNIVQIHEVGQHAGCPFLVLELVEGPNLARSLAGTPQAIARAVELVETLARAIHSAHRHGVIHRDLTPANILLTGDGAPKITDFGLAKIVIGGAGLRTQTGELLGTPSYMAPEQAAGRHRAVGAATDVYALGAILYEVLTGRPPFKAESVLETLRQVMADEPVAPSRLRPRLPRDLETICLKCLRKEPAQRYDGAEALAEELKRFREGRPILARRSSSAERLWRWCRRNPALAGANIAAAGLTTILAVVSTVAAWTFHGQRDQIVQQRDQISQDYDRIQLAEADTRKNLYAALSAQARATRFSRQVGQRFDSWRAVRQAAEIARELKLTPDSFDRLRDEAIACLALPDLKPTDDIIPTPPPGVYCASFDPTMTRYALRFKDGTIQVRDLKHDREVARFQARGDRGISALGFSPDGRYLATNHYPGSALTVWNIDLGTVALNDAGTVSSYGRAARFSGDSKQLALAHDDGDLLVYDLATGKPSRRWRGPGRAGDLAVRPDGAQIAVLYDRALHPEIDKQKTPTCQIHETETGRLVQSIPLPSGGEWITWSPDGSTLATACADRKVYLWDAATGTRRATLEGHTNGGLVTAFHPAGTLLASNGWENRLWLWDPVLGRSWLNVVGSIPRDCHFSRDGRIVLAREDQWIAYQVDPALEYRTLAHPASLPIEYGLPSVRLDGRILALATSQGVVLWDLVRGAELAFLPIGQACCLYFEPSGDLLTSGAAGVQRWPIQLDAERSECRVGPPHRLPLPAAREEMAEDRSGRIVAVANYDRAFLSTPERTFWVGPLDDCRYVAVSPDGEWLATGSHGKNGVHVWRIRDATPVAHPVRDGFGGVRFSPDGKWLMTWHPPCRLWEVATWREARQIGGYGLGFSPDGRLMVVRDASKLIRLVETETGHTLARFESPDLCSVAAATFSPDGSRLVVSTQDGPAVHIWDLRAIRRHLAEIGLDWDAAAYPESDPATENEATPPLRVVVNSPFSRESQLLLQQARALKEAGKFGEAIDTLRRAVRLSPDHADRPQRSGLAARDRASTPPQPTRGPRTRAPRRRALPRRAAFSQHSGRCPVPRGQVCRGGPNPGKEPGGR